MEKGRWKDAEMKELSMSTNQFKEALWCGVVVSPLISEVHFTHLIHTLMYIRHKLTH